LLLMTWKVAPALAAGCTVVVKPSEHSPVSTLGFAELFERAGFPAGVFNVVTGQSREVGAALAGHPGVDKVAFTGSTATGRAVAHAAAENLNKVTLELGGKSPRTSSPTPTCKPRRTGWWLACSRRPGRPAWPARGSSCMKAAGSPSRNCSRFLIMTASPTATPSQAAMSTGTGPWPTASSRREGTCPCAIASVSNSSFPDSRCEAWRSVDDIRRSGRRGRAFSGLTSGSR
jgi:Aldehyde dehydrogenase family